MISVRARNSAKCSRARGQEWAEYCANTIDKGITANGGYYAHQMYNIAITVNGTKAGSETYANAPVMSPNEDGTWHVLQTVPATANKWEYRGGEWVIVERIVTNDFGWHLTSEKLQIPLRLRLRRDRSVLRRSRLRCLKSRSAHTV